MAPRTILYTGKGGVGKTSVAAATARRCAAAGLSTIVLSTDPAHSLGDALEASLGGEPEQVGDRLWAQQVAAQDELERNWSAVQEWLGEMLVERGVDRISAEELTVPPGMDELFSLLQIKRHHEDSSFDVVIVDCAPTGETLRLLSFPDVARWWLQKVFPARGALLAAARPLASALLDVTLPGEAVIEDVERLVRNLIAMNEILRDHQRVSVRLVMTPDRLVIDEARRTFTYLNLYGYLTDAVVVNRVFPAEVGDYFGAWRERQQQHLADVEAAFAPVPVLRAPYFEEEVVGTAMLDRLGDAVFAGHDAAATLHRRLTQELEVGPDGARLRLDLPFAKKGDVSLKKIGLELVVRVDGHKRTLMLPPALGDFRPAGATFADGSLLVTFDGPDRAA
ncbi:MAG: arsenite/tail-anchored protein-transporting ATPase [Solirubrobacteraceae bacterium]|jgi:arsenite-transporting ATPase|nr:arsenite/tail-anchored protein-transporting ATPase [Solirubrobacteraceae bacterium]MEA2289190.1 arsenite/tail-anchored protein-transporting ATPase [Solirubrobacteraceae bacterium]